MKKMFLLIGVLLGLGWGCLGQSQPQSVAELARQKKPAKKAVLVLNDDDFSRSAAPADDADSSGPGAVTSPESATKPDSDKTDTAGDRGKKDKDGPVSKDQRTNELKQKLASYQKEEDTWKKSSKHYEDLLANESDDFRRQTYQDSLENDKHNAAMYQQKIDEIQNELDKQKSSQDSAHTENTKPDGSQP